MDRFCSEIFLRTAGPAQCSLYQDIVLLSVDAEAMIRIISKGCTCETMPFFNVPAELLLYSSTI